MAPTTNPTTSSPAQHSFPERQAKGLRHRQTVIIDAPALEQRRDPGNEQDLDKPHQFTNKKSRRGELIQGERRPAGKKGKQAPSEAGLSIRG
jgi:hypothetical protein